MDDEMKALGLPNQATGHNLMGMSVRSYLPKRNAVIVEFISHQDEQGAAHYQAVISIECKDQHMLPMLEREARRLQN